MEGQNQDREFSFIKEKIKDKPINKKCLLIQSLWVIFCGILFGVVSCITFVLVQPKVEELVKPEQHSTVTIPKDQEPLGENHGTGTEAQQGSTENVQSEVQQGSTGNVQDETQQGTAGKEQSGNQQGVEQQTGNIQDEVQQQQDTNVILPQLEAKDFQQMQNQLYSIGKKANHFMVTVTGVISDTDWFDFSYEKESQSSGIIIANNGQELLILTEKKIIDGAEEINITFINGDVVGGTVKKYDMNIGLAVISVPLEAISDLTMEKIQIADLGNSYRVSQGTVVLALGNPVGLGDSILCGTVTSASHSVSTWDSNYTMFVTDIIGSTKGSGVLINLEGQVVGLIMQDYSLTTEQNTITALSVSQLKGVIEDLSNGKAIPYLGIKAISVTDKIALEYGIPNGVYIKNVEIDTPSPAMSAGVQAGDILIQINGQEVKTVDQYTKQLMELTPEQSVRLTLWRQSGEEYVQMECEAVVGVLQ